MTPQCRLCGDLIYTQNPVSIFDKRSKTVRQIALVTGVWLTDHSKLPRYMCSCCLLSLKSAIAFRHVCIKTNNRLTIQRRSLELEAKDDACWDDPLSDAHEVLKINNAEVEQEVLYEESYADKEGLEEEHDMYKKEEEDEQEEFVENDRYLPDDEEMLEDERETQQDDEDMVDKKKARDDEEESQQNEESQQEEEESQQDEEESLQDEEDSQQDEEHSQQDDDDELWKNEDDDYDTDDDDDDISYTPGKPLQSDLKKDKKPPRKYTRKSLKSESSPKNEDTDFLKPAKKKRKTYVSQKVHVCDHCGKKFTDKGNFNLHVLRHSGVKPFECPECGQKEFNRYILNIHIRVKHRGEKPYACQFCGEQFVHSTMRSRHENRVHRNRKTPKNFKCNYCDKRFESNYQRAKHEVVHTGERNFHCEVCKVSFTRNSNLKTHYRSRLHQKRETAASVKSENDSKKK
ncbi:transcription factor Ouib [Drosophila teissieri]|uniref:transcription factor Ouib n=1 Tax=Drosophila teissieri TaxID=7243 RepID=UPI001CBA373A|nr:transcription factor Ouib [Drosophila teissieri]